MGKLKDIVEQGDTPANRVAWALRRGHLASLGLLKRIDQERAQWVERCIDAQGEAPASGDWAARIQAIGVGAVALTLDESRKLFEELVETGQKAEKGEPYDPTLRNLKITSASTGSQKNNSGRGSSEAAVQKEDSMELPTAFEDAQVRVKTLSKKPDNDSLLQLRALYKQALDGDVEGKRPGLTALVERLKYDAHKKLAGMSSDEAMRQYVDKVDALLAADA